MMLLAAINWHSTFFLLFALLACGFALGVLLSNNVVRMAFYLILSLSATAALFFLAGAPFVGAMQIMIYVGGTLVLLIFGVMLTAQQAFVSMKTRGGDWVLAAIFGGALLGLLVTQAFAVPSWGSPSEPAELSPMAESASVTELGLGLLDVRVDKLEQEDPVLREGMSGYLLPFEIISFHLLIVLIGAAYLARAKRRIRGQSAP
jgi:NADH-quinone oxidoreductase subunit J